MYDEDIDTSDKSVVVDWYYKTKNAAGRTILNYAKFVGDKLLYASENTPEYRDNGYYEHGLYPVVFDCLFPEKGTPVGFGYVAICKDPQVYIDKLSANILETSMMNTRKRFFVSESTNINEAEFADWSKPFVHVNGELSDMRLQEIVCQPLGGIYLDVVNQKIEEMKDTVGNRDVNQGSAGSEVTSGAAISALQEAGNKTSRDIITASYRAYADINRFVIELIRQFYDETRMFRITMPNGGYEFAEISNAGLQDQVIGYSEDGVELVRKPIFDLKIKAQRKNPFSRAEENERAKEMFSMGFFNPQNADMALMALDMMSFEGIEEIKNKISQGQTMYNQLQQALQENMALKQTLGIAQEMEQGVPMPQGSANVSHGGDGSEGYRQRLIDNAAPNVEGV